MWRIVFPLRYFRIHNTEMGHINLWPTLVLAAVIALPFLIVPGASFFRDHGFLDKLLALTSALTGFYIAALVAAATFTHDDLDKVIVLGSVSLPLKVDGEVVEKPLTRRQFACAIFGYLAFSAMILSLLSALFVGMSGADFSAFLSTDTFLIVRGAFVVAFSMGIAHLIVATCLGLYYMMDRLYRRDPKVTSEKKNRAA